MSVSLRALSDEAISATITLIAEDMKKRGGDAHLTEMKGMLEREKWRRWREKEKEKYVS